MASYVFTRDNVFLGVCTKKQAVVIWASYNGHDKSVVCMKYDDVGICEGEVDMQRTRDEKRLVMVFDSVSA